MVSTCSRSGGPTVALMPEAVKLSIGRVFDPCLRPKRGETTCPGGKALAGKGPSKVPPSIFARIASQTSRSKSPSSDGDGLTLATTLIEKEAAILIRLSTCNSGGLMFAANMLDCFIHPTKGKPLDASVALEESGYPTASSAILMSSNRLPTKTDLKCSGRSKLSCSSTALDWLYMPIIDFVQATRTRRRSTAESATI